jgi:hypothetical protein
VPLFLLIGVGSVFEWRVSELRGAGDLRFYAAVQLYSVLFLLIALLLPSHYTRGRDFAVVAGLYVLAKIVEALDRPIFELGHIVSGHTLKHLAAAGAGYWILRMLQKRRSLDAIPWAQPRSAVEGRQRESAGKNPESHRRLPRYR